MRPIPRFRVFEELIGPDEKPVIVREIERFGDEEMQCAYFEDCERLLQFGISWQDYRQLGKDLFRNGWVLAIEDEDGHLWRVDSDKYHRGKIDDNLPCVLY
jgi:hypothetical protein